MGIFKIIRNTNSELQYMYNALNYVLYGHTDYDKRYSLNTDIDNAYEQFLLVKKYFYKTSGNPIFHFIVSFNTRTTRYNDLEYTEYLCRNIAGYFADKYQIIWCIHDKSTSKRYGGIASVYHAHFVINSVSYIDGKMFSGSYADIYTFFEHIKRVTGDKSWIVEYGSDSDKRYEVDENDA